MYFLNTPLNWLAGILLGITVVEVPGSFFLCDQTVVTIGLFSVVVEFLQRKILRIHISTPRTEQERKPGASWSGLDSCLTVRPLPWHLTATLPAWELGQLINFSCSVSPAPTPPNCCRAGNGITRWRRYKWFLVQASRLSPCLQG